MTRFMATGCGTIPSTSIMMTIMMLTLMNTSGMEIGETRKTNTKSHPSRGDNAADSIEYTSSHVNNFDSRRSFARTYKQF